MKSRIRTHVAAVMLLAPMAAALVAQPAAAQHRAVVAHAAVGSMALHADAGLAPGSTLRVQVTATPGARVADVVLGDSGVRVPLRERVAGDYVGSHVVRRGEHIDPMQVMTARLTYGGTTVARNFSYPPAFQAMAMGAPAAAPTHAVIDRFVLRGAGGMQPGRELRFRLVGAPGGQAWVDIPGVARGVALAETRPGIYEANYVVRTRDNPDAFARAVATLQHRGERASARVDVRGDAAGERYGGRPGRDDSAPQISELTPDHGERVGGRGWTQVSARVDDEGSGLDPASVSLRLNGRDVTGAARLQDSHIRYREDLAPGRHTAELTVRDRAGNSSSKSWTFDVVERDRYGYYDGRAR